MKLHTVFLGLGTNVGDRRANLEKALSHIEQSGVHILKQSRVYETEPVGYADQEWFYNQVIQAETSLTPHKLLAVIETTEKKTGRKATFKWGPRVIDIDIIFYDDRVLKRENLVIPHPHFRERRFVLEPLSELVPELRDPVSGETIADLLNRCTDKAIVKPLF